MIIVQIAAASLRFLCLCQNNNYRIPFGKRCINFALGNAGLLLPVIALVWASGSQVYDKVIRIMYSALSALTVFYRVSAYRTRVKFTPRAICVYIVAVASASIAVALSAALISDVRVASTVCAAVGILAPLFTVLALALANPFYEKKNRRFIDSRCRKLRESNALKIGITGSYGKTSCKNILAAILERKYSVIATEKNYNTPMGIALTAERMTGREEIFIAEMGARRRGDIAELAALVKPDYSITTGVCAQHLATFKSAHNIFLEKSELSKNTGFVSVFNCNDKYALKMYKECRGGKVKVCCNKTGDVYADDVKTGCDGSSFKLYHKDGVLELQTRLLGKHNVINIALCAALALELDVSAEAIADAVRELKPAPHRLEYSFANGIHILDDSYNSNVQGIKYALEVLDSFGSRRVILSQGIVEGGKKGAELNRAAGREMALHADAVILCGRNAKNIGAGLQDAGYTGELYRCRNLKHARSRFKDILRAGDALLLQNDLPDVY